VDKLAVIGLGYVGLPLAVGLARHFPVVGVDIDADRIRELADGRDRTNEVEPATLAASTVRLSADIGDARDADIFIVTVPTPVDSANHPDLGPVLGATRAIAPLLQRGRGTIIVYESTVYPGVTEDICGAELARISGLERGVDFFLGYSPERINPGDREHTIERITKVVAGENADITERLAEVYGKLTGGNVFRAASIKVAEAAKVIENAQRDINIAFVNEITQIFGKIGLSIQDVLDAAGTKWNFLRFQPGLVGGHCIGVDPYYLAHLAHRQGFEPRVILAGRQTNDRMSHYVAEELHERLRGPGRILILGLTFKEDVPDLRNSKVVPLIERLRWLGHSVDVHDPLADADMALHECGQTLSMDALEARGDYDAVLLAVPHAAYRALAPSDILSLLKPEGLLADIKGIWRAAPLGGMRYWCL
jgi:UDP-N-acetyl-D-galactosamine dehydrogenase